MNDPVSLALSVNELLHRAPRAAAVLHRLGLDTCCGGTRSLGEAATAAGVSHAALLAALVPVLGDAPGAR